MGNRLFNLSADEMISREPNDFFAHLAEIVAAKHEMRVLGQGEKPEEMANVYRDARALLAPQGEDELRRTAADAQYWNPRNEVDREVMVAVYLEEAARLQRTRTGLGVDPTAANAFFDTHENLGPAASHLGEALVAHFQNHAPQAEHEKEIKSALDDLAVLWRENERIGDAIAVASSPDYAGRLEEERWNASRGEDREGAHQGRVRDGAAREDASPAVNEAVRLSARLSLADTAPRALSGPLKDLSRGR